MQRRPAIQARVLTEGSVSFSLNHHLIIGRGVLHNKRTDHDERMIRAIFLF